MAYDLFLAERIHQYLKSKNINYFEKKMFGGLCFMVNEKMCFGFVKNELMIRIDPEKQDFYLKKKHIRPMDFTHRPMSGFLYVNENGIDKEKDLNYWIEEALSFNPKAKASKKK